MSDNAENDEKQDDKQIEISLSSLVIKNRFQYECIINFIRCKSIVNAYVIPYYENANHASEFINNVLKNVIGTEKDREDFFKQLKAYTYRYYVDEDDYEWLIRDKQTCYFGWLYLKTLYPQHYDEEVYQSIISDKMNEKITSHGSRQETLVTYFTTVFYGYNHELLYKVDNNIKIEEYPLKNKQLFLDNALSIWGKYYQMPNQFKWLQNDMSGDAHKLIWNQLCTTVPFLKRNECNKQLEINRQNRLRLQEPRPTKE